MSNESKQNEKCDYLEINNNQALCTTNDFLITYDLSSVKTIEIVNEGISSSFLLFTEETRNTINDLNSNKKSQSDNRQLDKKQGSFDPKSLSIDTFYDFAQRPIDYFKNQGGSNTFSTILAISGLIVFLIGSFGFLLATFRAGILWGLSCIFLPLVSFVFLFVHWKTAAKPFLVTLLGIAIVFLSTLFLPANQNAQDIFKTTPTTSLGGNKKEKGNFGCNGKIYCSEMTSCAEAKFYLRNCPGTKMDGNNDGIPCEKQWCGH